MIIVAARATVKPGKREEFIKAAQPCIAATRKEEGCILYELHASTENENELLYYEQWKDREVLGRHMNEQHMKDFDVVKKERDLLAKDVQVDVFDVA